MNNNVRIGLDIGFGTQVAAIDDGSGVKTGVTLSHYGRDDGGSYSRLRGQVEVEFEGGRFVTGANVGLSSRTIHTGTSYSTLYERGSGLVAACLGGLSQLLQPDTEYDAELCVAVPNGLLMNSDERRKEHVRGLKRRYSARLEWVANGKGYCMNARLVEIAPQAACAHSAWINLGGNDGADAPVVMSATIGANTVETVLLVNNVLAREGMYSNRRGGVVDLATAIDRGTPYPIMDEMVIRTGKVDLHHLEHWAQKVSVVIADAVPPGYDNLISHIVLSGGGTQVRSLDRPRTTSGAMIEKALSDKVGPSVKVIVHHEPMTGVAIGALAMIRGGER